MPMLMQRHLDLRATDWMGCFRQVVVPMRMRRTPTVPMDMDMTREDGRFATQRRIERIMSRVRPVVMGMPMAMIVTIAVSMLMLGERGLKHMSSASMFERNDDPEFVRLRDLFDRLPVGPVIGEKKNLAPPSGTERLDPDGIGVNTG
jgi:hypothetical protein